jgi:hypothetical protein
MPLDTLKGWWLKTVEDEPGTTRLLMVVRRQGLVIVVFQAITVSAGRALTGILQGTSR